MDYSSLSPGLQLPSLVVQLVVTFFGPFLSAASVGGGLRGYMAVIAAVKGDQWPSFDTAWSTDL